MKKIKYFAMFLAIGTLFMFGLPNRSAAVPIVIGIADFSGSETIIDFESIGNSEEITNQYSALGVSFSGGLYGKTDPGYLALFSESENVVATNDIFCCPIVGAEFGSTMNRVGFDVVTNDPFDTALEVFVLSGGSMTWVGSAGFATGFSESFIGVEDLGGIDGLLINVTNVVDTNGGFIINNFRFEADTAPIPEPSTMFLLVSGLVGLVFYRRKWSNSYFTS